MNSKLIGFPKSYIITLPHAADARDMVISQLKQYDYQNYSFVPGVTPEDVSKSLLAVTEIPELRPSQIACTMAHLNAIKHWIENTEDPVAIIMEDDISTELIKFWNFSWSDFYSKIPKHFDIVQLCILTGNPKSYSRITFEPRNRRVDYHSTACYLISRKYGEELLRRHIADGNFNLLPVTDGVLSVADELLYDTDNSYSCPLFIFNDNSLEGRMSVEKQLHDLAYKKIRYLWETHAPKSLSSMFI